VKRRPKSPPDNLPDYVYRGRSAAQAEALVEATGPEVLAAEANRDDDRLTELCQQLSQFEMIIMVQGICRLHLDHLAEDFAAAGEPDPRAAVVDRIRTALAQERAIRAGARVLDQL
jgi:uncharacterized membrane protein YccC